MYALKLAKPWNMQSKPRICRSAVIAGLAQSFFDCTKVRKQVEMQFSIRYRVQVEESCVGQSTYPLQHSQVKPFVHAQSCRQVLQASFSIGEMLLHYIRYVLLPCLPHDQLCLPFISPYGLPEMA